MTSKLGAPREPTGLEPSREKPPRRQGGAVGAHGRGKSRISDREGEREKRQEMPFPAFPVASAPALSNRRMPNAPQGRIQ